MKEAIDKAMQAGGEKVTQDEMPVEASEGLPPKWSGTDEDNRRLNEELEKYGPNVVETDRPRMPATEDFGGAGTLPDGAFEKRYGRPRTTIVRPGSGYQPQPGEKVVEVPEEMAQRLVDEASDETTLGEIRERAAGIVEAMQGGTVVSSGEVPGMNREEIRQVAIQILRATTKYGLAEVAMLGLATTRQLLEEIAARGRTEPHYAELGADIAMGAASMIERLPGSMLDYRAAGGGTPKADYERMGTFPDPGEDIYGCWDGCSEGHTYGVGCSQRKRRPGKTRPIDEVHSEDDIRKALAKEDDGIKRLPFQGRLRTKAAPLAEEAKAYSWNKREAKPMDRAGMPHSCEPNDRHAWAHLMRGGEPISIPHCQLCPAYDWEDIRRQAVEYARRYAARLLEETYGYFEYPDGSRAMKWVEGRQQQVNIQQIYNLFRVSETVNLAALPDLGGEPRDLPVVLGKGDTWHQTRIGDMVLEEHLHNYEHEVIGWLRCRYVYSNGELCGDGYSARHYGGEPQNGRRIYPYAFFGRAGAKAEATSGEARA